MVSAVDTTKPFAQEIERFVKEESGGMYALVLHADDPRAALSLLKDRFLLKDREATTQVGTPAQVTAFGTRFIVE